MIFQGKDFLAGAFFVVVGFAYGTMAWSSLPVGRALNMGPGYFPLMMAGALVVLGAIIAARGLKAGAADLIGKVPWRSLALISSATLIFAGLLEGLGLFPAVLLTAFCASLAAREPKLLPSAVISLCIAIFSVALFKYGFKVPVPLLGAWLVE